MNSMPRGIVHVIAKFAAKQIHAEDTIKDTIKKRQYIDQICYDKHSSIRVFRTERALAAQFPFIGAHVLVHRCICT